MGFIRISFNTNHAIMLTFSLRHQFTFAFERARRILNFLKTDLKCSVCFGSGEMKFKSNNGQHFSRMIIFWEKNFDDIPYFIFECLSVLQFKVDHRVHIYLFCNWVITNRIGTCPSPIYSCRGVILGTKIASCTGN